MRERDPSPLVLASSSPRRRELLLAVGLPFDVLAVQVDEAAWPRETGRALAVRLAREKALAGAARAPGRVVLAADTVVQAGRTVLGKPRDAPEARRMLGLLAGRWHSVHTGVALVAPGGRSRSRVLEGSAHTRVRFADLSRAEIANYVAGAEPYDKAGGYALQGAAGWFVCEIRGSASNVVGLPLETVRALLRQIGWPVPPLGAHRERDGGLAALR